MSDPESIIQELLDLNQQLLDSIAAGDWSTYTALCDPTLSAFEPEARGHLVEGMEFHQFYFELGENSAHVTTTMSSPHVRLLGDSAIVCYVRLVQRAGENGTTSTEKFEETRVWQREADRWVHVHFHRSANA